MIDKSKLIAFGEKDGSVYCALEKTELVKAGCRPESEAEAKNITAGIPALKLDRISPDLVRLVPGDTPFIRMDMLYGKIVSLLLTDQDAQC